MRSTAWRRPRAAFLDSQSAVIRFFVELAAVLPMAELKLLGVVLKGLKEWLDWIPGFRRSKDEPKPGDLNTMMQGLFDSINNVRPNGGNATLPVFCRRVVTKIGEPNAERSEVVRSTYDRRGTPLSGKRDLE